MTTGSKTPAIVRSKPPVGEFAFRRPAGEVYQVWAEVLPLASVYFEISSATAELVGVTNLLVAPLEVEVQGRFLAAIVPAETPPGVYDLTFAFESEQIQELPPSHPIRVLLTV